MATKSLCSICNKFVANLKRHMDRVHQLNQSLSFFELPVENCDLPFRDPGQKEKNAYETGLIGSSFSLVEPAHTIKDIHFNNWHLYLLDRLNKQKESQVTFLCDPNDKIGKIDLLKYLNGKNKFYWIKPLNNPPEIEVDDSEMDGMTLNLMIDFYRGMKATDLSTMLDRIRKNIKCHTRLLIITNRLPQQVLDTCRMSPYDMDIYYIRMYNDDFKLIRCLPIPLTTLRVHSTNVPNELLQQIMCMPSETVEYIVRNAKHIRKAAETGLLTMDLVESVNQVLKSNPESSPPPKACGERPCHPPKVRVEKRRALTPAPPIARKKIRLDDEPPDSVETAQAINSITEGFPYRRSDDEESNHESSSCASDSSSSSDSDDEGNMDETPSVTPCVKPESPETDTTESYKSGGTPRSPMEHSDETNMCQPPVTPPVDEALLTKPATPPPVDEALLTKPATPPPVDEALLTKPATPPVDESRCTTPPPVDEEPPTPKADETRPTTPEVEEPQNMTTAKVGILNTEKQTGGYEFASPSIRDTVDYYQDMRNIYSVGSEMPPSVAPATPYTHSLCTPRVPECCLVAPLDLSRKNEPPVESQQPVTPLDYLVHYANQLEYMMPQKNETGGAEQIRELQTFETQALAATKSDQQHMDDLDDILVQCQIPVVATPQRAVESDPVREEPFDYILSEDEWDTFDRDECAYDIPYVDTGSPCLTPSDLESMDHYERFNRVYSMDRSVLDKLSVRHPQCDYRSFDEHVDCMNAMGIPPHHHEFWTVVYWNWLYNNRFNKYLKIKA